MVYSIEVFFLTNGFKDKTLKRWEGGYACRRVTVCSSVEESLTSVCVSMCRCVLWDSVLACVSLYQVLMSGCLSECFSGTVSLSASLSL